MKTPKSTSPHVWHSRLAIAFISGALLVSGCSSSGPGDEPASIVIDSPSEDVVESMENTDNTAGEQIVSEDINDLAQPDAGSSDVIDSNEDTNSNDDDGLSDVVGTSNVIGSSTDAIEGNGTSSEVESSGESSTEPVVDMSQTQLTEQPTDGNQPDPMSPVSTIVDFEITVPAYMSNRLQLSITWGDKNITSQWIGDEFWTASDTFPTNAKLPLTVTFSDNNGDIILAVYEADFQTGINASEVLRISVEQFETEQWDDDGDGVSNLSESIAGSNPLVIEQAQLEVVDSYFTTSGRRTRFTTLGNYEGKLTELPFFEESLEREVVPPPNDLTFGKTESTTILIDIDENGTGMFSEKYFRNTSGSNNTTIDDIASRTNTGESISYSVNWRRFNTSAAVGEEWGIIAGTQALDDNTRTQTGDMFSREFGNGSPVRDDTTYTLTGSIIEGTSTCEANYGTLTYSLQRNFSRDPDLTTVSKGVDDEFWNVTTTTPEGSVLDEYLARSLGRDFYCEFLGL